MRYTIYKITNLINGKIYIGKHQCKNPNDSYYGSGVYIKRAISKYGKDNFIKEVLFDFDNEHEMNIKEKEIVSFEFCQQPTNYNICEGGKGGFGYINQSGLQTPDAAIAYMRTDHGRKQAAALMYKTATNPDAIKKRKDTIYRLFGSAGTQSFKDKKHSQDTINLMKKLKEGHGIGETNSQFGSVWITNGLTNKKIKKDDMEFWLKNGYRKGRTMLGKDNDHH